MYKKTCNVLQDMLFKEKGINWNDLDAKYKRGTACVKERFTIDDENGNESEVSRWVIDENMPILTQDRDYIEKLIFVGE